MLGNLILTFLAEMFATSPPPGPVDRRRYGKSLSGFVNYMREQHLPAWQPVHADRSPEQAAALRNCHRWQAVSMICALHSIALGLIDAGLLGRALVVAGALSLVFAAIEFAYSRGYSIGAQR